MFRGRTFILRFRAFQGGPQFPNQASKLAQISTARGHCESASALPYRLRRRNLNILLDKSGWSRDLLVVAFIPSRPPPHSYPLLLPGSAGLDASGSSSDFQLLSGRRLRRTPPVIDFSPSRAPSRSVLWPLLTSHGKLYSDTPIGVASMRSPRVRARSFPSCSCLIYTDGSGQLLDFALSCRLIHRHMPDEVLVHQLKVLLRASFSLHLAVHTLPLAMRLPLPAPLWTFTH